jgi:phosphoglycerate dehydrogenase-like enzyme
MSPVEPYVDQVCERILRDRGHVVDVAPSLPEPELLGRIGAYDAVIVRSATKVATKLIEIYLIA